jgi:WG repeat protein
MRALSWIVVAACGGKAITPPPSNVAPHVEKREPKTVIENCEPRASGFSPGNHDRFSFEDATTNQYGFKDGKGNIVIPAIYPSVYEFSPDGMAGVVSPKAGAPTPFLFIDPSGKAFARAYAFDNGPDYFQEGYARIVDGNNRIGYIDERGAIAIAPKFTGATAFCHGKAHVEIGLDRYWIDRQGTPTKPPADGDEEMPGPSGA